MQADHVSGLPALVEATGATAYLPAGAGVEFDHVPLADGADRRARQHDRPRARDAGARARASRLRRRRPAPRDEEPWLVFTGDSLLVGDVGRPDLHAGGDPEPLARAAARVDAAAARAARPRARLPEPLRRLGLRPRALRQPVLVDRVRAHAQRGARARRRRRASRGRCSSICRRRPPVRRRSSRPTAPAGSQSRA